MPIVRRILHVSDSHYGLYQHQKDRFNALPGAIKTKFDSLPVDERPLILFTGDVVQDGGKTEFIEAAPAIDSLRNDDYYVRLVPGNHDCGCWGWWNSGESLSEFKQYLYQGQTQPDYPDVLKDGPDFPYPEVAIVGLNTMDFKLSFFSAVNARGKVGSTQRTSLAQALTSLQPLRQNGVKVVVMLHHHPFRFPHGESWCSWKVGYLRDHKKVMDILKNQVDILLMGHRHRHVNFATNTEQGAGAINSQYQIPHILCAGCVTEGSGDFPSWLIEIDDQGNVAINDPGLS